MSTKRFMLPTAVTDINDLVTIRNMDYPKLAACVPKGIYFLVTKSEALFWNSRTNSLYPVENTLLYTEIFSSIAYFCERQNCNVIGVLKPKKIKEDWFIRKLVEPAYNSSVTLKDVNLYLIDLYSNENVSETFIERFEKLESIVADIGDYSINTAEFKDVTSFNELAVLTTTSLKEDKNNRIIVRNKNNIFYDNTSSNISSAISVYSAYFELSNLIEFKGTVKEVQLKQFKTTGNSLYKEELIDLASFFIVTYKIPNTTKQVDIKVSLSNILNNVNRANIITIRKLWFEHKEAFIGKPVIFNAFALSTTLDEGLIGASFLNFNKI